MSQTAVSKHVRILSDAGLVEVEKRGRSRHCRLVAEPMRQAADWISDYQQFWMTRFDALGEFPPRRGGGPMTMAFPTSEIEDGTVHVEGWFRRCP